MAAVVGARKPRIMRSAALWSTLCSLVGLAGKGCGWLEGRVGGCRSSSRASITAQCRVVFWDITGNQLCRLHTISCPWHSCCMHNY